MASLNPFRRSNSPVLLASGEMVNLKSQDAINAVLRLRENWQAQAWDAFDMCGELHNACSELSNLMSRLVLFAAEQPEDKDARPVRSTDPLAMETVERLGSVVDVGQLLYDLSLLLVLIGEAQLVGIQPGPHNDLEIETWLVYSKDELIATDFFNDDGKPIHTVKIEDFSEGRPLVLRPDLGDTWIRIWRSHPRRRQHADSHVRALLNSIDELMWWDHAASAVAKSRLITAGAIGVPSNLELAAESGEDAQLSGAQRFVKRFFNMSVKTIQNPGAASAAIPIFYTYPWNETGKSGLDVTTFDRPQDTLLEQRTDRALRRIAQGFPLPVETFFGLGKASPFGSREISESKFRENVEPFASFLFAALTKAWYRPILRKEGSPNADKAILWYDSSNLIVHPDMTQGADKGAEYGFVSPTAWRRTRGFSERDQPSEAERQQMLEWLQATRGKSGLGANGETPQTPPAPGAPQEPTAPTTHGKHAPVEKVGTPARGKGQPVAASVSMNGAHLNNLGRRLAEIDADLLSRVQVMTDSAMRREQERAGNKLKNRAAKNQRLKQSIRGVGAEDIASTLGRETVIALGMNDLFTDSFDNVPALFSQWCDAAVSSAFSISGLPISANLDPSFRLSYTVDEAAQLLVRDLRELALTLLFDRAASLGPLPEADDLLVPASVVRRALNLAGGNTSSALLLTTGHAVEKVLQTIGHYTQGFEWWYGPKARGPYQSHMALDGKRFDLGDSPHQPGDVDGCTCLAVPLFS